MAARRGLTLIGLLLIVVGIIQLAAPRTLWQMWQPLLTGPTPRGLPPESPLFTVGIVALALGAFMLYVSLRRLTIFSTLIEVIGVLALIAGIIGVISPTTLKNMMNSVFYAQPDSTKMIINYVSGGIRLLLGLLFTIAGVSRQPQRWPD